MHFLSNVWHGLIENFRDSLTWASVRVTAAWGVVWIIFSQLPANVMVELATMMIWKLSVPAWMGIAQTISTYLARTKKAPS